MKNKTALKLAIKYSKNMNSSPKDEIIFAIQFREGMFQPKCEKMDDGDRYENIRDAGQDFLIEFTTYLDGVHLIKDIKNTFIKSYTDLFERIENAFKA